MIVWKKDLTKSCWSIVHTKNMKSPEIQTYQLAPNKVKWREAITTNLKDLQVRESGRKWIKCESSLTAWAYPGLFSWRKVTGSVFTPPGSGILVHCMLTFGSLLMLIILKKNYNKGHTFNRNFYWNGSGDSKSYGFFDSDVAFQSSVQVLWYPTGIDPKPVGLWCSFCLFNYTVSNIISP